MPDDVNYEVTMKRAFRITQYLYSANKLCKFNNLNHDYTITNKIEKATKNRKLFLFSYYYCFLKSHQLKTEKEIMSLNVFAQFHSHNTFFYIANASSLKFLS